MSSGHPVGVILTGGASKRMGVDKSTLIVDGKPMVVSVADALWEAGCQPVECQGGDAVAIGAYGLEVVPDREPGRGPLPAIAQALERHPASDVVVVACDLSDLDAATVSAIVTAGRSAADVDVAVASDGDRHLLAMWRPCAAARLAGLLAGGTVAYQAALDALRTVDVPVAPAAVRNVNTPADAEPAG